MTKELAFHIGKVTTEPKEGKWSTAFEYVPPAPAQKASRGVLMAIASISASPQFDADLAGRQVLAVLQENYYAQETGGILPALERAVLAAHQRLVTLVFSGQESEESIDFDLVVGVLWGSVFYLAQLGDGRAIIRRGGQLKFIGRRESEEEDLSVGEKPDIRTASGEVEIGEKILLASPRFYELVPADQISAALADDSTDEAVQKLLNRIGDEPFAAALVLSLTEKSLMAAPEPIILVPSSALEEGEDKAEPEEEMSKGPENAPVGPEVPAVDGADQAVLISPSEEEMQKPDPTPAEDAEPDPDKELSARAARDFEKYTASLKSFFSKIAPFMARAVPNAKGGFGGTRLRLSQSSVGQTIKKTVLGWWGSLGSPRTALESPSQARNRRTLLVLAAALLLILVAGIVVHNILASGSGVGSKSKFDTLMASAQSEYSDANSTYSLDRPHAKAQLDQATYNLQQAGNLHVDDSKVKDLQAKVAALLSQVNQIYQAQPSVFFDVSTLRPGADGAGMSGDKSSLYVTDPTGGFYQIAISTKQGTVLSSDLSLTHGSSIAVVAGNVFGFVANQGIYGFDPKTKRLTQASKIDSSWGKIEGMASYLSFLYLLDSGNNSIWRYSPASSSKLGSSSQWLKEKADLHADTSIVVDGSVWVAGGSDISKYTLGKKEQFSVTGVDPALSSIKAIYTDSNAKDVYLLEPGRLVVIDRSGSYVAQYKSDKLATATAVVIDESGLKAYILVGKIIYLLDLK